MFKPTSVCLSALSKRTKRVKVQILKDFPQFLLHRGEVAQVKPSLMRNYLHSHNNARYILQDSDIDLNLLRSFEQRQETLKSSKLESSTQEEIVTRGPSTTPPPAEETVPEPEQPKQQQQEPKKPKGVLEKDITVKDIKIPGLDL